MRSSEKWSMKCEDARLPLCVLRCAYSIVGNRMPRRNGNGRCPVPDCGAVRVSSCEDTVEEGSPGRCRLPWMDSMLLTLDVNERATRSGATC